MAFKIVLALTLVAFAAAAIDRKCLDCICKVESNCKSDIGCRQDAGSLSCGPYQIKEPYWQDCGKPGAGYKACATNKACAEKCVKAYMERYAARCHANPTCETYARVHNGGPNGCKSSSTAGYWSKVKKCLA